MKTADVTTMVISGGLNVYPRDVEEVLDAIAGVRESAVVGVPDPDLGERTHDADGRGVRPPAHQEPGQGHGRSGDPGEPEVGEGPPREDRRSGHRQRAEPVEQPAREVVGQARHRPRGPRSEQEGHRHDVEREG